MLKLRAARLAGLLALLFAAYAVAAPPPKLVLAIVVDQFRYDYLTRFRGDYHAGFERLLTKGAVFTNARYVHYPTVTAVGHSTFLSGATPTTVSYTHLWRAPIATCCFTPRGWPSIRACR